MSEGEEKAAVIRMEDDQAPSSRDTGGVSLRDVVIIALASAVISAASALYGADLLDRRAGAEDLRIMTVDTEALLAKFLARTQDDGLSGDALEAATRDWAARFQAKADALRHSDNIILIERGSVATGVKDLTDVFKIALQ